MKEVTWTKKEKAVARRAFETAYARECRVVLDRIRQMVTMIKEPSGIWNQSHQH
jgi:hypothetical protein